MAQPFNPVADPASVVTIGNARFTFLTSRLVRMEWSPDGRFEDRASFAFVNRRLATPTINRGNRFAVDAPLSGGGGTSETFGTDDLRITYSTSHGKDRTTRERFDEPGVLEIKFRMGDQWVGWTPQSRPTGNLKGTVRTLDGVSGSCELEQGLLSRDGWALIDDSQRLLLDPLAGGGKPDSSDIAWATPRKNPEALDWYFFAYGHDFKQALADFIKVAGKIPLPPRYVLGSWWSRYWAYTDKELKDIVHQFDEHGVPLDVLVIDMDWHLDGWTGYTWNKDYFPDSKAFLRWCKDQGLRVTLNLHPADGVGKHEAMFNQFKAAMGVTEKTCYRIPFDCTDRRFVDNYFKLLHHPQEEAGVDFWWMDWQQGNNTKIPGLDPLFWLNYLHWVDMERRPKAPRPLIFSRWGGLGNHRYQIGFSGDTYNNWESLAFQPYFTATAANVGYGYWSHDIGGHQPGPVGPELYARWIQYGIFSPVLRTHCGKRPDAERRIWAFPDDVFKVCKDAFELRYALIPYTYTACRQAYDTGVSLCRPMYYDWPEHDEAYARTNQYMFGDDLMIAPVVTPADPVSGVASAEVWFPPAGGDAPGWVEWCSGRVFNSTTTRLSYALRDIPVFARSGAVIPMQPPMRRTGEKPADPLILNIFDAGPRGAKSGAGRVYEDDGLSSRYQRGEAAVTRVSHSLQDGERIIDIAPAEGSYPAMARERAFEVRLPFVLPPERVTANGAELARAASPGNSRWWYDERTATLTVRTTHVSVRHGVRIGVKLSLVGDDVLRAGLIGQLNVLDDVLATLGPAAPASIKDAAAIRACIETDPQLAMAKGAVLQADWWSFMDAINRCTAPGAAKRSAQARLLGLSCTVSLHGDQTDAGTPGAVKVTADVSFAPRFARAHDAEVSVEFDAAGGWQLRGAGGVQQRLKMGHELRAEASLAHTGVPSVGSVATRVVINEDGTRIALESHESFCPSINAWTLLGPFDGPQEDELKTELIPEGVPVDLSRTHTGMGGKKLAWTPWNRAMGPHDDPRREFFVDFHKAFGGQHDDAVAYAVTWLESESDQRVRLALGSDDGAVAWVNGEEVFRKFTQRGYAPRDDRFEATLRKGVNELVLKIGQAKGAWGFSVFVDDLAGRPAAGVRVVRPDASAPSLS